MPLSRTLRHEIVLAAINARYRHTSFGLRYLHANLGAHQNDAVIVETTLQQPAEAIVDAILVHKPRIVGLGVYVWNAVRSLEVVRLLKAREPDIVVVLGGPEVSYEWEDQSIVSCADYTVCGEGEAVFRRLCAQLLGGERPEQRIWTGESPPLSEITLPYAFYTDEDVAHRVMYVEASRGCPYRCQFCLSSLDRSVRMVPLESFFEAIEGLLERGARDFKFIDRTFNLRIEDSARILQFFLDRLRPGLSLHFEMIPDRLPERLRTLLAAFPPGVVQLEIGIQTFDEEVSARIERRQDEARVVENLRFLADHTGVHVHADLIVGLPGEDRAQFGAGFDRLLGLGPQEIQVGILKRLRGTPIVRHDASHEMVYRAEPPYDVLHTRDLSEDDVVAMNRFAKYWDRIANSGNFIETAPLIWEGRASAFWAFSDCTEALYQALGRTHSFGLHELSRHLFSYLVETCELGPKRVAACMVRDLHRTPGRKTPRFLRPHLEERPKSRRSEKVTGGLQRQQRHSASS